MSVGRMWLGLEGAEVLIEQAGRSILQESVELARQARTANGTLVKDIVAVKERFTLTYSVIEESTIETFLALYALGEVLSLLVEEDDGAIASYDVMIGTFPRTRLLSGADVTLWQNVPIVLEEV